MKQVGKPNASGQKPQKSVGSNVFTSQGSGVQITHRPPMFPPFSPINTQWPTSPTQPGHTDLMVSPETIDPYMKGFEAGVLAAAKRLEITMCDAGPYTCATCAAYRDGRADVLAILSEDPWATP